MGILNILIEDTVYTQNNTVQNTPIKDIFVKKFIKLNI